MITSFLRSWGLSILSTALGVLLLTTLLTGAAEKRKLRADLSKARKELSASKADADALRFNNGMLLSGLNACNASVEGQATVANAVARTGAAALEALRKSDTAQRRVAEINALPDEDCADALNILKEGGK